MAMYEIVPDSPLAIFAGPNTRTRSFGTAQMLAAQEAEHFGVPHTIEEVRGVAVDTCGCGSFTCEGKCFT